MSRNDIILAVVAAVLVVFSLTVAMVVPRRDPTFPGRKLGLFVLVCALLVAGMLTTVEVVGEEEESEAAEATETTPAEPPPAEPTPTDTGSAETAPATEPATAETEPAEPEPGGDPAAGKSVFAETGCGSCHTLAAAGTSGAVGPVLDDAKPSFERVVDRVTNGKGVMPSFKDVLSEQQINDVAAYVVQSTSS